MAEIKKVIKNIRQDGSIVLSNIIDNVTGEYVTYESVDEYYDGSNMNNSKCDGIIYRKLDDVYYKRVMYNSNTYLEKDNMEDMRDLSDVEILLLKMNHYKGVTLNGYYTKSDTTKSISYILSNTTEDDDAGSVIKIKDIVLEHEFIGEVDIRHFGAKPNIIDFDNALIINSIINKYTDVGIDIIIPTGLWYVGITEHDVEYGLSWDNIKYRCIELKSNINLIINGSIKLYNPTSLVNYSIILVRFSNNNVITGTGSIVGCLEDNTSDNGEWGYGVYFYTGKNHLLSGLEIYNCFGDGIMFSSTNGYPYLVEDVTCRDLVIRQNRRQGISVSKCRNVLIDNCVIYDTGKINGTLPMAGIDFEPENNQTVEDVIISNCRIYDNKGQDIAIIALTVNSVIKDVTIRNNILGGRNDINHTPSSIQIAAKRSETQGNIISDIHIIDNTITRYSKSSIIDISNNSKNINIIGNSMRCNVYNKDVVAISMNLVSNIIIKNNNIKNVRQFAHLTQTRNINIEGNKATNLKYFCQGGSNRYITVNNNEFNNSDFDESSYFIRLYGGSIADIINNKVINISSDFCTIGDDARYINISNNELIDSGYDVSNNSGVIFSHGCYNLKLKNNKLIIINEDNEYNYKAFAYLAFGTRGSKIYPTYIYKNESVEDATVINEGYGMQRYYDMHKSSNVSNSTIENASDLPTAIALVNEVRSKLNAKLDVDRLSGQQRS